jgi:hypothetical protein
MLGGWGGNPGVAFIDTDANGKCALVAGAKPFGPSEASRGFE